MARVTKNVRWLLTAWVLMAFPAGLLHAQKIGVEDVTPVYDLVKTIKRALPYHDTAYRFTVTRAMINTDYRYVKLTVVMDSTETVDESTKALLFDYFMHHSPWQLKPLEEHTFDLTLYVLEDGKPVSEYYTYTTLEMQEALSPSIEVKAKRFLLEVSNAITKELPQQTDEYGETLVQCYFDTANLVFLSVYEYPDSNWTGVKDYVSNNTDEIRRSSAVSLIRDTTVSLDFAVMAAGVTMKYRYRDRSRTDSVEVNIAPWMWEFFYKEALEEMEFKDAYGRGEAAIMLSKMAEGMNKECPSVVDSFTTMTSCVFDSASRELRYSYRVDELIMLNLEKNSNLYDFLKEGIVAIISTEDGMELVKLLVEADASLVYYYTSQHTKSPLVISFTPPQLKELLTE